MIPDYEDLVLKTDEYIIKEYKESGNIKDFGSCSSNPMKVLQQLAI